MSMPRIALPCAFGQSDVYAVCDKKLTGKDYRIKRIYFLHHRLTFNGREGYKLGTEDLISGSSRASASFVSGALSGIQECEGRLDLFAC